MTFCIPTGVDDVTRKQLEGMMSDAAIHVEDKNSSDKVTKKLFIQYHKNNSLYYVKTYKDFKSSPISYDNFPSEISFYEDGITVEYKYWNKGYSNEQLGITNYKGKIREVYNRKGIMKLRSFNIDTEILYTSKNCPSYEEYYDNGDPKIKIWNKVNGDNLLNRIEYYPSHIKVNGESIIMRQECGRIADPFSFGSYVKKEYDPSGLIVYEEHKINERLSKDNGPARVFYINGKVHIEEWYMNGVLHRNEDLPARTEYYGPGKIKSKQWFVHGVPHRELPLDFKEETIFQKNATGGPHTIKYNTRGFITKLKYN